MSTGTPINYGPYLLTHRLASNSVAELFAAKTKGIGSKRGPLVIKRLVHKVSERPEFIQSLASQGRLVCNLEHPNILQVYELGEIDDTFYIAMEYVHGFNVRQLRRVLWARRQQLPLSLALYVISETLKGLGHAHRAVGPDGQTSGVIHQGVSPSNILLSLAGEVKISDFDIPQIYCNINVRAGEVSDRFGYMAPEQLVGARVDHRADLFSVGIILAELLTGQRLFKGQSSYETLDQVLNVRLGPIQHHLAAMPEDVVSIIHRSMQRNVNSRYQSAGEFREAVDEVTWRRRFDRSPETLATYLAQQVIPFLENARKRITTPPPPGARSATENTAIFPADLTTEATAILPVADLTTENTTILAAADLTTETTAILSNRRLAGESSALRAADLTGEVTSILSGEDLDNEATAIRSSELKEQDAITRSGGISNGISDGIQEERATKVYPWAENEPAVVQEMFDFDPDPTPVVEVDLHVDPDPTSVEDEEPAMEIIVAPEPIVTEESTLVEVSCTAGSSSSKYAPHLLQTVVTPRWFEELLQSSLEDK